jgi:hypothetical protein
MDYLLTEHARIVIEKRRLRSEWIEQALGNPEELEKDPDDEELEHRLAKIEEFGGRVLRVIVNIKARPVKVVTVYFDRRSKLK